MHASIAGRKGRNQVMSHQQCLDQVSLYYLLSNNMLLLYLEIYFKYILIILCQTVNRMGILATHLQQATIVGVITLPNPSPIYHTIIGDIIVDSHSSRKSVGKLIS